MRYKFEENIVTYDALKQALEARIQRQYVNNNQINPQVTTIHYKLLSTRVRTYHNANSIRIDEDVVFLQDDIRADKVDIIIINKTQLDEKDNNDDDNHNHNDPQQPQQQAILGPNVLQQLQRLQQNQNDAKFIAKKAQESILTFDGKSGLSLPKFIEELILYKRLNNLSEKQILMVGIALKGEAYDTIKNNYEMIYAIQDDNGQNDTTACYIKRIKGIYTILTEHFAYMDNVNNIKRLLYKKQNNTHILYFLRGQ
eukprot:154127_1